MKILVAVLLLLAAASADATDKSPPQHHNQSQDQSQEQSQSQDQSQYQVTQSWQNNRQVNLNEQSVNVEAENDITLRNTAPGIAPNVYATSPCVVGGSLGLGIPAFNVSGGRGKVDGECEKRETARILGALGERELAVMLVCQTEVAMDSLGEACRPNADQTKRIAELEKRIDVLLREREIEREQCNKSKDRIAETCRNDK